MLYARSKRGSTRKNKKTNYRKKCVTWAKNEAKKKADYICERCGKDRKKGWAMHGSHVLPEGTYISMSADVDNITCLCYLCHFQWWHKNPLEASSWFKDKYPGRMERLILRARENHVVNWQKRWEEIKSNK